MGTVKLDLAEVAKLSSDKPVMMLNLLRYREQADFPLGYSDQPCSGREAYQRYAALATPLVLDIGGHIRFAGQAVANVVSPKDERWHDIIIVEYSSPRIFVQMATSADYQRIVYLRTTALEDSRLIAMQEGLSFQLDC
ncbi:MAG: DUF1330 domain-containing protein [Porticoccaceae bacterium]|nr:DUF1330 domain-containing protein [Porticoccaceae bacterium]